MTRASLPIRSLARPSQFVHILSLEDESLDGAWLCLFLIFAFFLYYVYLYIKLL